ncbi:MAG: PAS domain-containing protein [Epsilonproteobacteria bacterium]|nr:PAS domain-containing protein [Campylobacterota bacterium]
MKRPMPIDIEIVLEPKKYIISSTDLQGLITEVNDYFVEVSGYSREELIGKPHSIIRHPDMPKIVFKLMWERLKSGKDILALVKNLAKDGRFYWIFTTFEPLKDDNGDVVGYTAHRKAAPKHTVETVAEIYRSVLEVEKSKGINASEKFLNDYLQAKGEEITFVNLMDEIYKF